jgi:autotransporter-associated beta strand protein
LAAVAGVLSGGLPARAQVQAFPEAQGFAASATGGRAGAIYHVTNLNDSGTGSFRDAVSQSNRIVVFDVGGYINLTSAVGLKSNITLLGQTAPGMGIGFTGAEVSWANASNSIARYLRFRPGDSVSNSSTVNAVSLFAASNVILDHVSIDYAPYNNIDGTTGMNNITVQNSIIADPLLDQQFGAHTEGSNVTWLDDLWANAHNRQPLAKADTQYVNNIIYNYQAGYTAGDSAGNFQHDIVNNYFITGPATGTASNAFYQMSNQIVYSSGNMLDSNKDGVLNGSALGTTGSVHLTSPWSPATSKLPTMLAANAFSFVLANAGANMHRDDVDNLVVSQVQTLGNGTTGYGAGTTGPDGGLYHHAYNSGLANSGLGNLPVTTRAAGFDTDNDGIPDTWETSHGLNSAVADSLLKNPVGLTLLEQYADELVSIGATALWNKTSGNWTTAANWSGAALPGVWDTAEVRGTGAASGSLTISSTGPAAMRLSIGGNSPASGDSVSVTAGTLTIYDTITVGDQNNASLVVTGGTVTADNIQLGNTLPGSATYTGNLSLTGGMLQVSQIVLGGGTPGNWNTGGSMIWSGGTVQAASNMLINVPISIGAGNATVDTNSFAGTFSGALSGNGSFIKTGAGTLTLSVANSLTGNVTVSAGTLALTSGGALPNGAGKGNVFIAAGATIDAHQSQSINALTGAGTYTNLGGTTRTLFLGHGDATGVFSGAIASVLNLVKNGLGTQTLSGQNTYTGNTTASAGSLVFGQSLTSSFSFTVNSSASAGFTPGGNKVLATTALTINGTGKFDLADNDLIINYIGGSPIATIRSYLTSGFNAGRWNGAGLDSSAAGADAKMHTALGYAENSTLGYSTFDGQSVGASALLVKYTYYGDNNLDGKVNASDFQMFLNGFVAASGSSWSAGDYTYDGKVDLGNDFDLFLMNYLAQGNALGDLAPLVTSSDLSAAQKSQLLSLVPEPGAATFLTFATGILPMRRRKRFSTRSIVA